MHTERDKFVYINFCCCFFVVEKMNFMGATCMELFNQEKKKYQSKYF